MKAIVQDRYGGPDTLRLAEVDTPVAREGEVLVRVRAASVHPDVWHVLHGTPLMLRLMGAGLRRPRIRIPGTDLAGTVESVGPGVTGLRPGDEVFGESVRGHQWHNGGAYAEYALVPAAALALKPTTVTFEQAAAVPTTALISLQAVREQGHVRAGDNVLINGAGGGVGGFAVQLAKAAGAHVTGVDDGDKQELMRSLGADVVLDYTREDFTRTGERYDVVIDIPGNHPIGAIRRALTPRGTYVFIGHEGFDASGGRLVGRSVRRFLRLAVVSPFVSQQLNPGVDRLDDKLTILAELLADGQLNPVLDRTYPLEQVPDAMRRLVSGKARGRIVITVDGAA